MTDLNLKYFTHNELKCRSTGIVLLAPGFGEKLDDLREEWGKPLKVNSCCRSIEYNKSIGGASHSYHIYEDVGRPYVGTCAIDFAFLDGTDKGNFVTLAWRLGWRVEVRDTWVHVDLATIYDNKPQIMFTK